MNDKNKAKAAAIIKNHMELLADITADDIKENPVLLLAVTNSIKQTVGLLAVLDKI